MTDDRPELTVLDADECWRLLAAGGVGRVAMDAADGLVVVPVNFAVEAGVVVFRTTEGGLLGRAAEWGRSVAFEVDQLDHELRQGWSVLVRGELRRVPDEDAGPLIERVAPWARGQRNVVGTVTPSQVSGRRVGTLEGELVMRRGLGVLVPALVVIAALVSAGPADAAATQTLAVSKTLALWNMNEAKGATVLVDSSGNGINGTIGGHVVSNGSYETFPYVQGGKGGTYDPAHIDLVDSALINPGTKDFAITARFKFTLAVGDLLQKGQTGAVGGLYKIELDGGTGKVDCSFVSPTGSGQVWSSNAINDGAWHVVTCTRTATQVSVTVDGVVRGTINHATGAISNTWPLSIGGKSRCNQVTVFCDYFAGQVDYVQIQTS